MKRNHCCSCGLPFSSSRQLCTPENKIKFFSILQMKSGWLGRGQFLTPGPGQAACGQDHRHESWAAVTELSERLCCTFREMLSHQWILFLESWHYNNTRAQWNSELTSPAILSSFKAHLQKGELHTAQVAAAIKNRNIYFFLQTASESLLSTDHDRVRTTS